MIDDFETAKNAIAEILAEVDEFHPEKYHLHQFDPENENIEDSIRAVCQALMDSEWQASINMQELQAQHLLTHDGTEILKMWNTSAKSRSILDFNNLLGVNIDLIIQALVPLVVSNIFQRLDFSNTMALGTILTLTPSNILPWTNILIRLSSINKFRPLQERMSQYLNKTSHTLDNPSTYSSRFGDECMQLWHKDQIRNFNITLCSSRADTEVASSVKHRISAIRLLLVEREVRLFSKIAKGSIEEVEAVLTTFCYMVRLELASLRFEFQVDDRGNVVDNRFHTIYMGEIDMEDEFLPMLESIKGAKYSCLLQQIKHLDYQPWLNLLLEDYDLNTTGAVEVQDERLLRQHHIPCISVSRVDILTCKNMLQALREDLPRRGPDWNQHGGGMQHLTGRIMAHFTRIPYYDEMASTEIISPLILQPIDDLLNIQPNNLITVDRSWTITPIGLFNISMSRLAWVLEDIGLRNIGDNRIIAALGDGYGGYTQVINQLTGGSKIIFMTSPTSLNEQPVPTLYPNSGTLNEVDTYMIEIDRWDLTEWSNFSRLEEYRNNLLHTVMLNYQISQSQVQNI